MKRTSSLLIIFICLTAVSTQTMMRRGPLIVKECIKPSPSKRFFSKNHAITSDRKGMAMCAAAVAGPIGGTVGILGLFPGYVAGFALGIPITGLSFLAYPDEKKYGNGKNRFDRCIGLGGLIGAVGGSLAGAFVAGIGVGTMVGTGVAATGACGVGSWVLTVAALCAHGINNAKE